MKNNASSIQENLFEGNRNLGKSLLIIRQFYQVPIHPCYTLSMMWKLRLYRFFDDFVIIYPLYTIMFRDSGLNLSQISTLLLMWSASSFVLEVPSGVLADKYDRKTILVLAQIIRIIGYVIWLLYPTYLGFLIGFFLWGIKSAFTSGTLDAYVYDSLEKSGKVNTYAKVSGELKSLSFLAILLGSFLASTLFSLGYPIIMLMSISALVISTLAIYSTKSIKSSKSTKEVKYFTLLVDGINLVLKNSKLSALVLISSTLIGVMAVDEYLPLYLSHANVATSMIGYIFALFSLTQAFGSIIAHKFNESKLLTLLPIVVSVLLICIGCFGGSTGVGLFILLALVSSVGQVVSNSAVQHATQGHVRATVGSVVGFLAEMMAFAIYIVFSTLTNGNINLGFLAIGIGLMAINLIGVLFR